MAVFADRVQESWTGTGTGAITLGGALTGFQSFAAAFGSGSVANVPYTIVDGAGNWETGHGTLSGSTNLTRSVVSSSNANALVNFPSGTKNVFNALLATDAVGLAIKNIFTSQNVVTPTTLVQTTGTVAIDASTSNNFEVQLTQNATIGAPTNLLAGGIINLAIQQPASGGPYTLSFASVWDFGGATTPVASTGASKVDFVSGYYHSPTSKILASYRKGS